MRILIASSGTIPGYSGGWTTTLDLLGDNHESMYVISNAKPGLHSMEGVKYVGLGFEGRQGNITIVPHRLGRLFRKILESSVLKRAFRKFNADFVMCLDESMGFLVQKAGLPYAMRFHTKVDPSVIGTPLETLLKGALFSTACKGSEVPGVEEIPHNQDLSRFSYAPAAKPERALLITAVNEVHEPDMFVQGICLSKNMRGDIIGTGPSKNRIKKVCRNTKGRVRLLEPVPRLKTGQLSGKYQVGVATIIRRDRVVYQMKINMYLACGMHTLVKPYTHIAKEAPELIDTFSTPRELAEGLDKIVENWRELEPRRKKAREWVLKNYSVEISRERFRKILKKAFGTRI